MQTPFLPTGHRRPHASRPAHRVAFAALALLAGVAVVAPTAATAHPLGNFTTNAAAAVTVATDRVDVRYALDLAEIPALQAKQRFGTGGLVGYGRDQCAAIAADLSVRVGATPVKLGPAIATVTLPPGQGGLTTLRLECRFSTSARISARTTVAVDDGNFAGRIGWREVTVRGDGVRVASALPAVSPSDFLRHYPSRAVASPLKVTSGSAILTPGGALLSASGASDDSSSRASKTDALTRGNDRLSRSFTSLISHRHLSLPFAVGAILLACVLGAFHALAPGHGKTLMAAYVVGRRGGKREVLAIGSTVALAHTAGVVVLGVLISTSEVLAPERAMKWLTALSGVLLIVVGAAILVRRLRGQGLTAQLRAASFGGGGFGRASFGDGSLATNGIASSTALAKNSVLDSFGPNPTRRARGPHGVDTARAAGPTGSRLAKRFVQGPTITTSHDHGGFTHSHVLPAPGNEMRAGSLIAMGLAGGLVPSPSALVVLLGAITLGRVVFGIGLVAAYGVGMAATLMLAGLLLVRAEAKLRSWTDNSARVARMVRWFPVATAALLVLGGLSIVVRAMNRA